MKHLIAIQGITAALAPGGRISSNRNLNTYLGRLTPPSLEGVAGMGRRP